MPDSVQERKSAAKVCSLPEAHSDGYNDGRYEERIEGYATLLARGSYERLETEN